MSIRSAYLIAAATTLTLCPAPGDSGPGARPAGDASAVHAGAPGAFPAARAGASAASLAGAGDPRYPPHAPPVYDRRYGWWRLPSREDRLLTPGTPPPPVFRRPGPPGGAPTGEPRATPSRPGPPAGATARPSRSAPPAASPVPVPSAGGLERADPRWGKPVFVESFAGPLDRRRWEVYHSPEARVNPRTGQATTVHDGMLHMKGGFYGGKDLSGGVASTLSQTHGRWEVRFRGEVGRGYSLVTLLWSSGGEYAEIDFSEVIDPTRRTGGIYVHRGEAPQAQSQVRADFTKWHTVAVDWLPGRLTFWLDGRQTWSYTGPLVPEGPMHLTLQNDVVCNQWSPCRDSTTPATVSMYVDWVRIFRAP
ncbi:glycoside hydrolase family 16 protein [Sphaerisporangium sp. TRM90804]|uniref:glycoside hydrolase family 16 protein n=1 Tax=Sphaerisporangium sp. TRM90804 TaxID=3031113 RepID=UPI00244CC38C|nr:glycoside hydrolase family 16 protein [Sphaerisporangium sp. TRM90804]MDH2428473.1 glycoside hydrolase family 16 protein [Sphaerisporangium sp. TRM90804]